MKLKPYPEYKASGVEWLGIVPSNWDIGGVTKFIGPIVDYRGRTPNKVDDGIFLVTARNIKNGKIDYSASEEYVDADSVESLLERGRPEIGDVLFTMEAPLGQVALIDRVDIALAQRIVKFRGKENVLLNTFLLRWLMGSYCQAKLETLATGSTALGIKSSKLGEIECLIPPLEEQSSIVTFLDKETAKLDTLIANQEKLIELLQEKRQAIISHAVTKGLDPRVKMIDSGVEWLGMVPEHWEVFKGKKLFKIVKRIAGKLGYDVLSITQKGIKVKDITSGDGQLSMDYSKYQLVEKGDFAMNHMDLLTGFVDISNFNGVTSPDYRVFKLANIGSNYPEYYLYILQNCYNEKLFFPYGQGSSQLGRWRLPTESFNYFEYPYPPIDEQLEIVKFLRNKIATIDKLISRSKDSIDLAKEHRIALISAAVTGKIDVTEYAK